MVKWTKPAKHDLKEIFLYIKKDSEYYAKKVANEIVDKSESLNDFPQIGRIVPELNDEAVREIFVYSYRMIYQVQPQTIKILALIHGRSKFKSSKIKR